MNKIEKTKVSDAILPFILIAVLIISGLSLFSYGYYVPDKKNSFKGQLESHTTIPDFGDNTCYDFECKQNYDPGCSSSNKYCESSTYNYSTLKYTNSCYSTIDTTKTTQTQCTSAGGTWNSNKCLTGKVTLTSDYECEAHWKDDLSYYSGYDWHQTGSSGGHSTCQYSSYEEIPSNTCTSSNVGNKVYTAAPYTPASNRYYVCQYYTCGSSGGQAAWVPSSQQTDKYLCSSDNAGNLGNCTHNNQGETKLSAAESEMQCYAYTCESHYTDNANEICKESIYKNVYNDGPLGNYYEYYCYQHKTAMSASDAVYCSGRWQDGYCFYGDSYYTTSTIQYQAGTTYNWSERSLTSCSSYDYALTSQLPACNSSNAGATKNVKANYIMTYDNNGGTGCTTEEIPYAPRLVITENMLSCVPTKTNYIFDGWYTSPTGGSSAIGDEPDSERTYYAHWSIDPNVSLCNKYTCKYVPNLYANDNCDDRASSTYCGTSIRNGSTFTNKCYDLIIYGVSDSSVCTSQGGDFYTIDGDPICLKGLHTYTSNGTNACDPNGAQIGYYSYKWALVEENTVCPSSGVVSDKNAVTCSSYYSGDTLWEEI